MALAVLVLILVIVVLPDVLFRAQRRGRADRALMKFSDSTRTDRPAARGS